MSEHTVAMLKETRDEISRNRHNLEEHRAMLITILGTFNLNEGQIKIIRDFMLKSMTTLPPAVDSVEVKAFKEVIATVRDWSKKAEHATGCDITRGSYYPDKMQCTCGLEDMRNLLEQS